MSQVIPVHNPLSDTKLWKVLNEAFKDTEHEPFSDTLASNLIPICEEASIRMKAMFSLHPQYTLHDEKHLLRVVELMPKIMPKEVLSSLNPIEISLLILSAYFHDQGMILDQEEYEDLYSDSKFLIFKDDWETEHPNLKEVQEKSFDKTLDHEEMERCIQTKQELFQILISDYIRGSHAQRSSLFAKSYANDKRLDIAGINLSSYVAKLCYSHCQAISDLTPTNEYYHDESIGQYKINMTYLALVLRLADILDFDRDRTPESLFKTIHFDNNISIREWEKHRSVQGWEISPERIRFTMQFEHPTYEKAAREFMDLIDDELDDAKNLLDSFPEDSRNYHLKLPSKTDRSRIKPKDNAYIYYDLEFSLSRDEVVKLLMTDNLYDSPSLCVRELLQNSLDALRYRKALIKRDLNADWTEGKIELEHSLDEHGQEILRCTDNGVGMDMDIIKRFLTNVGRSYYRSPEFNRERVSLEKSGCDFDPCSQFGIGFMSCFMIGDRIFIRTRRSYGNNRSLGKPLLIDINGLSGMVVVRMGSQDQTVGTTVEIISRKKPNFFSRYHDNVRLLDVVDGYALACEFPIEASCRIPEIEGMISIPPHFSTPLTKLEAARLEKCKTFSQNFSEIDTQLGGQIRTSILIDDTGKLTIANSEAIWELEEDGMPVLRLPGRDPSKPDYGEQDQICLDGILVCGMPGRRQNALIGYSSNNYVYLGRDYFILDVRGKLKPPLTPARAPPRDWKAGPRWIKLNDIAQKAHGRLWEQIVLLIGKDVDDLTFWKLAVIHRAPIQSLRKHVIWDKLSVPVMKNDNEIEWQKISSLGTVRAEEVSMNNGSNRHTSYIFLTSEGNQIASPDDITKWEEYRWRGFCHSKEQLYATILGFCELDLKNDTFDLNLKEPDHSEKIPSDNVFNSTFLLPYSSRLNKYLSVQLPFNNANINHPLVKLAYDTKYLEDLSDLQLFARHMIGYLGNSEVWGDLENNGQTIRNGTRYALRYLGHLASNLSYPEGLQPPYCILSINKKEIQICQKDLERWADLKPKEE